MEKSITIIKNGFKYTYQVNMRPHVELLAGTSLRGYFPDGTTYDELCAVFGPPNGPTDGYKIDAVWIGMINDYIFSIYNYKTGRNYLGSKGLLVEKITDWHIGGKYPEVADMVVEYFQTVSTIKKQMNVQRPSVIRKLLLT